MKQTQTFLEWNNNVLIKSLKKIDLNIILIIILDALFYLLSGYLAIFVLRRVETKIISFDFSAIASLSSQQAELLLANSKSLLFLIIFSVILLAIAVIFIASILKGIIWAKTLNAKISFALISKFLAINLIWMGFWLAIFFLILFLIKEQSVFVFLIIAVVFSILLTNTLYTKFIRENKFSAIFTAIKLTIAKIHMLILPYIIIFALLLILIRLSNLLQSQYSSIFVSFVVIAYAAIVRYYISTLMEEVEKA